MTASGRSRFATLAGPLLVAATQVVVALWATSPAVAAPPPDLPQLIGRQVDDAVRLLPRQVAVELLPSSLPAGVDRDFVLVQDVVDTTIHIDPGPTTAVRLVLGARVPDLTRSTAAEAARAGALRGLAVQRSPADAPDGATVRDQSPAPSTLLPLGDRVTVRVSDVVETPALVTVPKVVGLELAEVRRTLEANDLILVPTTVGAVAVSQSLTAGSQVRRGSRMAVRFGPAAPASATATPIAGPTPDAASPASSQSDAAVLWLVVLVAALAATAVAGFTRARIRRRRSSQRPDVRGHPSPPVTPTLTELGPPIRIRVQLVPHPDDGTQTMEEARHD